MTRNERKLKAVEDTMAKKAREIQDIWALEEKQDRELNEDERSEVLERTKALDELRKEKAEAEANIALEKEVKDASRQIGSAEPSITVKGDRPEAPQFKSLGKQFVESKQYKTTFGEGTPGGQWQTGQIELEAKGTLLSGGTLNASSSPYDYQTGITETLFQKLTVADLIPSGTTDSPQVRYNKEKTATNAAAGVAEGGEKPESTLAFEEVTEPVKKIATVLPVSDEMLEDAGQIESYINQRLSLFIKIKEENSLLRGLGTNDLTGIIGRSGVNTVTTSGTAGTAIVESLFTVLNNTRGSSLLEPDGVVMNPTDWAKLRTSKDAQSQYYGGGPFYGPYGGPQGPAGSSQFSTQENVWGVRVVVTSAIGAGTALVGAFSQGAQVFRRSGLTVEATNSHSDFFVKNLTAIRAEERLALAVYRPAAFTTITWS